MSTMLTERDGGGMPLPRLLTVTCFIAIAWQNVLGLNLIIWFIFKKWSGLYFWMVLIASWGILLHQLGFFMMFFGYAKTWGRAFAVIWCGWVAMVTGQSLVLYSRLHLVLRNTRKLRWVLYVIIANAVIWHSSSAILMVLSHNNPSLGNMFHIWENVEVTLFGLQEVAISILYIIEISKFLCSSTDFRSARSKSTMLNVLMANIFIILLDLAILCTQYANLFQVQVTFKGAVYSVKLIIEFFILNQLVDAVGLDSKSGMNGGYGSGGQKSKGTYQEHTADNTVDLDTVKSSESKNRQSVLGTMNSVVLSSRHASTPPIADHIRVTRTLETSVQEVGGKTGRTAWSGQGRTSPTSSEIEFAKRGY